MPHSDENSVGSQEEEDEEDNSIILKESAYLVNSAANATINSTTINNPKKLHCITSTPLQSPPL